MMSLRITTEEQREKIIKKLANIMKDHINEEAEEKARKFIRDLFDFNMDSDDRLTITYDFEFNGCLLKMLLGSVKREDTRKKKGKK